MGFNSGFKGLTSLSRVGILTGTRNFSHLQKVQTGLGTYPAASYAMSAGVLFRDKEAGT